MKKFILALIAIMILIVPVNGFSTTGSVLTTNTVSKYFVTDVDQSGDPQYFGYTAANGNWYIMQYNVASNTYRYKNGTTDYTTSWTGRAGLTYTYFYSLTW